MERYTIRILYRDREDPAKLVGLLEGEGIAGKRGFIGMEGLWRILNAPDSGKDEGARGFPGKGERPRPGNPLGLASFPHEE